MAFASSAHAIPQPEVVASTERIDFGSVAFGARSVPQTVSFENRGEAFAEFTLMGIWPEGQFSDFGQAPRDDYCIGWLLPGDRCYVDFVFEPRWETERRADGSSAATFVIQYMDPEVPNQYANTQVDLVGWAYLRIAERCPPFCPIY